MKKILIILAAIVAFSCADEKKDMDSIRKMAKEDAIEKLGLPEGTKFDESTMEISETESIEGATKTYIVKVNVKSQNAAGEEMIESHTMTYKKPEGAKEYELQSFE